MNICEELYSIIQEGSEFNHDDMKLCDYACDYYDPISNFCYIFGDLIYNVSGKFREPVRHEKCMELLSKT